MGQVVVLDRESVGTECGRLRRHEGCRQVFFMGDISADGFLYSSWVV